MTARPAGSAMAGRRRGSARARRASGDLRCRAVTHRARKETGVARSLALRALAGAGAFAASMALGTGWAGAAPTAGAGTVSSRTFSTPAQAPGQSWCDFLAWLYGWDVCGGNNGGGPGPGNGNGGGNGPGGPPTTVTPAPTTPTTAPPVTVSPAVPVATLPPATPPPATPAPTTVPPATQPPATHAARARGCRRAGTVDGRSHHTDQPHHRRAAHGGHHRGHGPVDPGHADRRPGRGRGPRAARCRCAAGRRARAPPLRSFAHPLGHRHDVQSDRPASRRAGRGPPRRGNRDPGCHHRRPDAVGAAHPGASPRRRALSVVIGARRPPEHRAASSGSGGWTRGPRR